MREKRVQAAKAILALGVLMSGLVAAQQPNHRSQLQSLAKQNGEVYIALEYPHAEQNKDCRLEDVFTNTVAFSKDTLIVDFDNYTESFCEATKLETRLIFRVHLRDLDPAKTVLVQRKYNLKNNKLLEGEPTWYEVQTATLGGAAKIIERSELEAQTRRVSQLRIIFKNQDSARRALAALRALAGK